MSATVADALDDLGCGSVISATDLAPLRTGQRVCGPAVTLRYRRLTRPVSENKSFGLGARLGDRDLFASTKPGDVADCPAPADTAVVGAISARWATRWSASPRCIVSGAVRDSASILDAGLPV
ncbi:MAG TPA: hypothetical protein VIW24_09110 [Aldersonia sp.]